MLAPTTTLESTEALQRNISLFYAFIIGTFIPKTSNFIIFYTKIKRLFVRTLKYLKWLSILFIMYSLLLWSSQNARKPILHSLLPQNTRLYSDIFSCAARGTNGAKAQGDASGYTGTKEDTFSYCALGALALWAQYCAAQGQEVPHWQLTVLEPVRMVAQRPLEQRHSAAATTMRAQQENHNLVVAGAREEQQRY